MGGVRWSSWFEVIGQEISSTPSGDSGLLQRCPTWLHKNQKHKPVETRGPRLCQTSAASTCVVRTLGEHEPCFLSPPAAERVHVGVDVKTMVPGRLQRLSQAAIPTTLKKALCICHKSSLPSPPLPSLLPLPRHSVPSDISSLASTVFSLHLFFFLFLMVSGVVRGCAGEGGGDECGASLAVGEGEWL